MWFVEQTQTGKSTVAAIAKRVNLKESTLRSWKWRAENNGALYNRDGRPHQVSPAIKKSLKTIISSNPHQIADHEALNVMQKLHEEEAERYGIASASVDQISRRTYKRTKCPLSLRNKKISCSTTKDVEFRWIVIYRWSNQQGCHKRCRPQGGTGKRFPYRQYGESNCCIERRSHFRSMHN